MKFFHALTSFGILALISSSAALAQTTATTPQPSAPPPEPIFARPSDDVGVAQQIAHAGGLQARILWMDATANIGNLNTPEKITDIVGKVKNAGMNTIVLDVKPIVGDVIYPSKFAPRLTEWRGQKVDPAFDVLQHVLDAAHAAGLQLYANLSIFGEGHKFVSRGLAYTHPDWQTTLYEVDRSVQAGQAVASIAAVDDLPPNQDTLAALTNTSLLKKDRPGYTVAILNFAARVMGVFDGAKLSTIHPVIPSEGSALIGSGRAGGWLLRNALPDRILTYGTVPKYVRAVDAPELKYTVFCDPQNPEVRRHEMDIVKEIVTNYPIDGVIFDDRLRYSGLNADFSAKNRAEFEQFVGRKLTWPDDVFTFSPYPGQKEIPGPAFQQWLNWRAANVTRWLADAASAVRGIRPDAQVAVYAGSWYGDYAKVGSNWAAPDFTAQQWPWLTPEYRATGYAGHLDWITTGCYNYTATLNDALANGGTGLGGTVEAAGQLSNRVVNDAAWTYAGLYTLTYHGHPAAFARAIKAAAATTQGVMVFDLSDIVHDDWWSILNEAFAAHPAQAPNTVPGLLDEVREQHAKNLAAGIPPPPLPPYQGVVDIGF